MIYKQAKSGSQEIHRREGQSHSGRRTELYPARPCESRVLELWRCSAKVRSSDRASREPIPAADSASYPSARKSVWKRRELVCSNGAVSFAA